jgi:hypothetical protein
MLGFDLIFFLNEKKRMDKECRLVDNHNGEDKICLLCHMQQYEDSEENNKSILYYYCNECISIDSNTCINCGKLSLVLFTIYVHDKIGKSRLGYLPCYKKDIETITWLKDSCNNIYGWDNLSKMRKVLEQLLERYSIFL